jgi:hypothetical protein
MNSFVKFLLTETLSGIRVFNLRWDYKRRHVCHSRLTAKVRWLMMTKPKCLARFWCRCVALELSVSLIASSNTEWFLLSWNSRIENKYSINVLSFECRSACVTCSLSQIILPVLWCPWIPICVISPQLSFNILVEFHENFHENIDIADHNMLAMFNYLPYRVRIRIRNLEARENREETTT